MLPQKRSNFDSFSSYMDAKESKLRSQFHHSHPPKSSLFTGVCVHVNGRTQPPLEELRRMVLEHGGRFEQYYHSERVTHVLCTHVSRSKQLTGAKEWQRKLTKPQWVLDCVREGKLLDCRKYRSLAIAEEEGQQTLKLNNEECGMNVDNEEEEEEGEDGDEPVDDEVLNDLLGLMEADDDYEKENLLYNEKDPIDPIDDIEDIDPIDGIDPIHCIDDVPSPTRTARNLTSEEPEQFIQEFYKNSRLHHLSRWRMESQQLVNSLSNYPSKQPNNPSNTSNLTLHVDLDCFFVAVSLLSHPVPDTTVPLVVCHGRAQKSDSSSDISSCNYAARSFGIRNGMYLREALKLCPNLQVLPYDFDGYRRVMHQFYRLLVGVAEREGGLVEAVSCDEAYLLMPWPLDEASTRAADLRAAIRQECGIEASIGMGGNRLIARMATRHAKPANHFLVTDHDLFLADQRVIDLPGIGESFLEKLNVAVDVKCSELLHHSLPALQNALGSKNGLKLFQSLRGIDDRPWERAERKSVGSEISWGIRFSSVGQVKRFMDELVNQIWHRLSKNEDSDTVVDAREIASTSTKIPSTNVPSTSATTNQRPKKISIKLYRKKESAGEPKKFLGRGLCDCFHRSRALPRALTTLAAAIDEAWRLFEGEFLKAMRVPVEEIRGIGVFLSDFGDQKLKRKDHIDLITAFDQNQNGQGIVLEVFNQLPKELQDELRNQLTRDPRNELQHHLPKTITLPTSSKHAKSKPPSSKPPSSKQPLNTLTQLWGHRERRQLEDLHAQILALPDDCGFDKEVLLALPMDLQRESLDEYARRGIKPSEEVVPVVKEVINIENAIVVNDHIQVSFQGRSEWTAFELYAAVKLLVSTQQSLQEVDDLLVELALKECFKPISELCKLLHESKWDRATELSLKIKRLVHDLYNFHLK